MVAAHTRDVEALVIGGGIIGLASARALALQGVGVAVLEAEDRIAAHQTGRNSGVIHSGLYYPPGSLKASNCTTGRRALVDFCERRGIAHEICGKVVVAVTEAEVPALEELERRGRANGLTGLQRLDAAGIRDREPHVSGVAGLLVPETGIVDYREVARALADDVVEHGGTIHVGARVRGHVPEDRALVLETDAGTFRGRTMVNCAGLQADRVASLCGITPPVRIVPFRGDYLELLPARRHLVRHLVYPVPDPALPFLGVHFTRRIDGTVEAGPNAVLALRREGYGRLSFSVRDAFATATWPGFWRLTVRYLGTGVSEWWRSMSRWAFARALRRLVPEVRRADLVPSGCGVRAQALERDGSLVDDFRILETARGVHVLNAPSPAATASLAIGDDVARLVRRQLV